MAVGGEQPCPVVPAEQASIATVHGAKEAINSRSLPRGTAGRTSAGEGVLNFVCEA